MSPFKSSLIRLLCLFMVAAAVAGRAGNSRRIHGRSNKEHRVIGGQPVQTHEYAFLASLRVMPKELHRCGGFLISPLHVATTASCIYSARGKDLHAYLDPLRLDSLGSYHRVKEIVTHPNFTLSPHEHDIAIVTLDDYVEITYPSIPDWVDVPSKTEVLSFGWGYDMDNHNVGNFTMHKLKLQVTSNGLCSLVLREYLDCNTLCGTSVEQFATGRSDVGTPLIVETAERKLVVGMLVRETEDLVNAAAYLKLRPYRDWIYEIIGKAGLTTTTTTTTTNPGDVETTTTIQPSTTTGEGEDEYDVDDSNDYQEQPIKGRSRKKSNYYRHMYRDPSPGKRQISRFGYWKD